MSETSIQLKFPLSYKSNGGTKIEVPVITLRRMKAKDLKTIKFADVASDPSAMFPLIAALSGLPIDVVEELDIADLKTVTDSLTSFWSQSPAIGKTSSGE